jgi:methionyl-tRNA synthetase
VSSLLVTATPPTPNGDLHLGHLAGPFLAADAFNRFQRMRGNDSAYLTSSDDHQSYVVSSARRRGLAPEELARSCAADIEATLAAARIEVDCFTKSSGNGAHAEAVQDFVRLLAANGLIVAKEHALPHCRRCSQPLFESFARGRCPYCGEGANGNLCEACGRVNDPLDLIEPSCGLCGGEPEVVPFRGLFLPLEPHREALEELWDGRTSWRPHLRALCGALLAEPLPDYPVGYPTPWGVPLPLEGFPGQAVNAWLEMYPGMIQTARTYGEREGEGDSGLARALFEGEATLVQFLGYDNGFFNAVLHSAVALALGGSFPLPEHVITNEFYRFDGEKFSTSRGHAIWGREILAEVESDALRYHLARTNPEHWQTSFSREALRRSERDELNGAWEEAIEALCALAAGPAARSAGEPDLQARGLIGWAADNLERFYGVERFSLRHASAVLDDYVRAGGEYAARGRSAGTASERAGPALGATSLLRALSIFAAPLMPTLADRVWARLGRDGTAGDQRWDRDDLEAPHRYTHN